MDLPPSIAPPPEVEARELGLDALVFDRLLAEEEERPDPLRAYLLVDASCNPAIPIRADNFKEPVRCLFDGSAFEDLGDVAPWLIEFKRYGDAWDWFVADGWGNNWGIVVLSRLPLAKLKRHFKKFIRATDEDGEVYFFKFYRPQHLNTYLPVFDADQTARFMEGIDAILTEDADGTAALIQRLGDDGALTAEAVDVIALGMPLRVQPPGEDEVDRILAAALSDSDT